MSISEQVKELRETAELFDEIDDGRRMLLQAADTIEALSAKLAANMEQSDRYYNYSNIYKDLDSLHSKILTSDLAENVTENEIMALHKAKHIFDNPCYTIDEFLDAIMQAIDDTSYHICFEDRDVLRSTLKEYLGDNTSPVNYEEHTEIDTTYVSIENEHGALLKRVNTERSDRYYGDGWISCEDRLPEEGVKVLVWFEYFRYGEYNRLFQTTGISYTFNGEWSGFVNDSSGWDELKILAWQPLPEPYRP